MHPSLHDKQDIPESVAMSSHRAPRLIASILASILIARSSPWYLVISSIIPRNWGSPNSFFVLVHLHEYLLKASSAVILGMRWFDSNQAISADPRKLSNTNLSALQTRPLLLCALHGQSWLLTSMEFFPCCLACWDSLQH